MVGFVHLFELVFELTVQVERICRFGFCTPYHRHNRVRADLQPSQQKKRLEKMLADLGLKGAPTLSKAKALKEKRELAAELGERPS